MLHSQLRLRQQHSFCVLPNDSLTPCTDTASTRLGSYSRNHSSIEKGQHPRVEISMCMQKVTFLLCVTLDYSLILGGQCRTGLFTSLKKAIILQNAFASCIIEIHCPSAKGATVGFSGFSVVVNMYWIILAWMKMLTNECVFVRALVWVFGCDYGWIFPTPSTSTQESNSQSRFSHFLVHFWGTFPLWLFSYISLSTYRVLSTRHNSHMENLLNRRE